MHTHLANIKIVDQSNIQISQFQTIFQDFQIPAISNPVFFKIFHQQLLLK